MTENYYNKDEKIKVLKSYLGNLFVPIEQINKKEYLKLKELLSKINSPCSKLLINKKINTLKIAASIILTKALKYEEFRITDIDTLMNTWLNNDSDSRDSIKNVPVLVILSLGGSFFKNIKGLTESVVKKREFDNKSTIILTTQLNTNLSSCFDKTDIIEIR